MSPHATNPLMPHLVVSDCDAALDWYARGLGAREIYRAQSDDGARLLHAAMEVNGAVVMLNDDFPEFHGGAGSTPQAIGGSPVVLHVELPRPTHVDEWVTRAREAGATVKMGPDDMFWGDRYARLTDPYGHEWSIGAPLAEEVTGEGDG